MTPHEQATKLVHDYYAIINGSPLGENVNQEALEKAIERAKGKAEVKYMRLIEIYNLSDARYWKQVLNKLNEM